MDAINNRRVQIFIPGDVICIDELTSKWCGLGDWYDVGLPHITKCPRKPWNLGMEFKDAMCAKSGIMLQMEICEGKEEMENKKFCGPGVNKGTAMVKRLTEPWHGSGRCVVADSYFASVTTAIACMMVGLYFTGIIKTC